MGGLGGLGAWPRGSGRKRPQGDGEFHSLIVTARMNDVDPQAWLADVLARIASHPARKIDELLPWNWKTQPAKMAA